MVMCFKLTEKLRRHNADSERRPTANYRSTDNRNKTGNSQQSSGALLARFD